MQSLIVFLVILAACVYIGGKLFKAFRSKTSSSQSCSGCIGTGCSSECSSPHPNKINKNKITDKESEEDG
ncbi:MAG: FeoB-associated Cys-rich membrane protein [Candidatus Electrothrix sp. AR4]|nr:FeoB-associated Cys-rich membrane protein [Candidatus Electrothrix sp. AR4]